MAQTNQDYRRYLTSNAEHIMHANLNKACEQSCGCAYKSEQSAHNVKYTYKSQSDNITPYGYEHSDLKESYIRRQLHETAKASAPIITTQQYLKE